MTEDTGGPSVTGGAAGDISDDDPENPGPCDIYASGDTPCVPAHGAAAC